MVVALPAVPVAVKVAGLPVNPVNVALSVFVPAVVPSVQLPTVATPLLPELGVAPVTDPPPLATANVTVTPATTLAFASVTFPDGATGNDVPAVAL